jgi:archaellum biogenesis ATPase FlaH
MKTYTEIKKIVNQMLDSTHDPHFVENNLTSLPDLFDEIQRNPKRETLNLAQWSQFDFALGGLRMNEFTILCGPSGYGKTTFLANLAMNFIAQRINTFIASVEIGKAEMLKKMVSSLANVSFSKLAETGIPQTMKQNFFYSHDHLFTNYESRVNHRHLLYDLYFAHINHGTKIAIIDNMNYILDPSGDKDQIAKMDKVIHEWVVAVKHLPIHVFMVMHPRKTDDGRVDNMYDIKGSSTAIQEAQNVLLFNALADSSTEPFQVRRELCRELSIAKCRYNGKSRGAKIIYSQSSHSEQYVEEKML